MESYVEPAALHEDSRPRSIRTASPDLVQRVGSPRERSDTYQPAREEVQSDGKTTDSEAFKKLWGEIEYHLSRIEYYEGKKITTTDGNKHEALEEYILMNKVHIGDLLKKHEVYDNKFNDQKKYDIHDLREGLFNICSEHYGMQEASHLSEALSQTPQFITDRPLTKEP